MKKTLFALSLAIFAILATSCGKKSADEIFEEQKSGVVLVLNKFYYEVVMPGGQKLYFNGLDQNGNMMGFTTSEAEAKKNAQMLNGTGFFIGDDGKFITNRHVAITDINTQQLRANLANIVRAALMQCAMTARQIKSQYNMLEAQKSQFMEYDFFGNIIAGDDSRVTQIVEEQQRLMEAVRALRAMTSRGI